MKYTQDMKDIIANPKLPLVSGLRPFRFNVNGHHHFLASVFCCRREKFCATPGWLCLSTDLGYLAPDRYILNDGSTIGMYCGRFRPYLTLSSALQNTKIDVLILRSFVRPMCRHSEAVLSCCLFIKSFGVLQAHWCRHIHPLLRVQTQRMLTGQ